ncbi:enoyl-CoA hydratase-related protein [Vibrio sp. S4M6]|uniref:enoyl-CoA hydratase-related protein n=1 Tax=Vibrio sinus TaxID=2946865 RepID=UPI00202A7539|nr:enoyl-CoA hydratase-related protein [Vibrio sinus]MCL9781972.1 enoyl-CoA hydratase-related protein [Vibrio sinus]
MNDKQNPDSAHVICDVDKFGVATLTLNRADKSNAFGDEMIELLLNHLSSLRNNPQVRCLTLRAKGKHFSAGADLSWMKSMATKSHAENVQDAQQLAKLMHELDTFPHPTIALVHGCAFGGALGLICCSDIALTTGEAIFCFSEVKLGLIPATIGPYACRAMGTRQARRFMLTSERFNSAEALKLGVVHEVVESEHELEDKHAQLLKLILNNSPGAVKQTKSLCLRCDNEPLNEPLIQYTSQLIADARVSEQGQEGLQAFFEKRSPNWVTLEKES